MDTIRVIIIDAQPLFREGIRATLQRMEGCEIIGESTDAYDVLELARTHNPDVASRRLDPAPNPSSSTSRPTTSSRRFAK